MTALRRVLQRPDAVQQPEPGAFQSATSWLVRTVVWGVIGWLVWLAPLLLYLSWQRWV